MLLFVHNRTIIMLYITVHVEAVLIRKPVESNYRLHLLNCFVYLFTLFTTFKANIVLLTPLH